MKKQKSGLYRTAVTVNGQKVWLSAKTKAELETKKKQTKEKLIYGMNDEDITFHTLVNRWWNEVKLPSGIRMSTVSNQTTMMNKWIMGHISDKMYAKAIRRTDLQQVINAMSGLNREYVSACKHIMQQICSYGMELGCMRANFAANLVINKETTKKKLHKSQVPQDAVQRIFAAAGDSLPLVALLYFTGLRRGQAVALTWADVDFDAMLIHVNKAYDDKLGMIAEPKTENAIRDIPLPQQLAAILKPIQGKKQDKVLHINNGHTLRNRWLQVLYKAGCAKINERGMIVPDFTPHQLRHCYATTLHKAGIDPVTASRIMGHASYKTTADTYTDITTADIDKSAIEQAFAQRLHKGHQTTINTGSVFLGLEDDKDNFD